jgi:hypothetical protein
MFSSLLGWSLQFIDNPQALVTAIMQILKEKQHHRVIAQMARPDVRDDLFTICGGCVIHQF